MRPAYRFLLALAPFLFAPIASALTLQVTVDAAAGGNGSAAAPFGSLAQARDAVRVSGRLGKEPITVELTAGTYFLPEAFVLEAADSGTEACPVVYRAAAHAQVTLSGGEPLSLAWQPWRGGILVADVPAGSASDQLFVNGQPQRLARYPNFDPNAQYLGGGAADAFSPARVARWKAPAGGIIHALDKSFWGDFHYVITGVRPDGTLAYEGGWQTNRPMEMHPVHRYVENIFEELDAPGEWFLDGPKHRLYFIPPAGLDVAAARFEFVRLKSLVEIRGTAERPVRWVSLRGLTFARTRRTFMETKEPLLRSDWAIYRGAAIHFVGAEDCALEACRVEYPGGNAVFVDGYNRRVAVRDSLIEGAGASGVLLVGGTDSVRSPLLNYAQTQTIGALDPVAGPRTANFPSDCRVEDCLIHDTGREEKQSAGVEIEVARRIAVVHCSIYDTPRAGINFGDGAFGGDVIDGCDVFDTVRETGDHGSFNAWGRDRYWRVTGGGGSPALALLDAVEPNVIERSRWRCDNGWDIDLDDGSSNYQIHDNLLLHGGLKLREGYYRVATNNVIVNNSLHPHVWFADSHDIFAHNVVMGRYRPALMKTPKWGEEVDHNFFASNEADRTAFLDRGCDVHSLSGNPHFVDPAKGDFRVTADSPALAVGFRNFAMDQFGVTAPWLKALARTPEIPRLRSAESLAVQAVFKWDGGELRDLGPGEFSAVGVSEAEGGVLLSAVPSYVALAHAGLRTDDLVTAVAGRSIHTVADLIRELGAARGQPTVALLVRRHQADLPIELVGPLGVPKPGR